MLKQARLAYVVVCGALVAAYYRWEILRPVTTAAVAVVSVAAIWLGLDRLRPRRWGGWLLIAGSVLLLGIGDVVLTMMADGTPGPVVYPGPPDVFYVAAYVPLALGLLWLGRPQLPSRDWPLLLDTITLSLAGSLLLWVILVRPAVMSQHLTGGGKVIAIASWVGFVGVLATAGRVVIAWRTNLSLGLLASGVLAFLTADFLYGRQLINGTWSTGSVIDLGFLAFSMLAGAAVLTESVRQVASAGYARNQLGPVRLTMVAIALLVAPTVLLVQATAGPVTSGAAIAVVSAAVGVLMLVRLSLSAQAYRARAIREQAVAIASGALVRATTTDEVLDAARHALRMTTTRPLQADVAFERHARTEDAMGLTPRAAASTVGDLRLPIGGSGAPSSHPGTADPGRPQLIRFTAALTDLVELEPVLEAVAHQVRSALDRIALLADLRADERERYFRSLVLTSEDVTLISRDGRVTYATPSAQDMFGSDIVGRPFDAVVPTPARLMPSSAAATGPAFETAVQRPDGRDLTVRVRRRDLTHDPAVGGIVATVRDVTAERRLQRDLAYRASHDQLTGLANAQTFSTELQDDETTPEQPQQSSDRAALFIDLDDFKTVNDTYGHAIGDQLLTEVAQRIRSCLRTGDLAARLGGDEFAVLLRDLTGVDAARTVAQRIADTLARPAIIEGVPVDCQASIGLAYAERPGQIDMLMREADTALYTAKAHGKGKWRQYQDGMRTPTRRNIDNRRRLQAAITNDSLVLQYQPIVALDTGVPLGFEALIRFPDSDPPMQPQEIIDTAEETGLITTLGDWIVGQALTDLNRLNPPDTPGGRYISVNLSARQLRRPDFVETVRQQIARAGADPSLLILEVTESLLVDSDDRAWSFLAELRQDGIRVAIDDYGTGYASLSYLRQPAIDIVKIDKSFLATIRDQRSRALLRAVIALCHELGLEPIAEGVQGEDSVEFLRSIGCRYGQGFHFATAMPITDAVGWGRPPG
jgi:diguanylate cyclase (GGDEF)-like protein/PAS domain S-box-containing protein